MQVGSAWSQVQVASAWSQAQVASARSQVQVASARSQVQVASARSQVQVASARSQVQLTCEELQSLLRAAGWRGRGATTRGFSRFCFGPRDLLRGSAWSRCKNSRFFTISALLARPPGDRRGRGAKSRGVLRLLLFELVIGSCLVVRAPAPGPAGRGFDSPLVCGRASQAARSNLHKATCAEQLVLSKLHRPVCAEQLAQSNLHTDQFAQSALPRATCAEQLTQSNLHRATCTEQLAQSNLQGATCTE